jgi:hypothetical protein
MDINRILTQLRAERDRFDKVIAALAGMTSTNHVGRTVTRTSRRGRRRLTAAGRKRLSELLKKRWASGKMGRRKTKAA